MNNDKNEAETIKFKQVPNDKYHKKKNYESCLMIVIICENCIIL